ncbi:cAMP-binding domain of CRP or a regulatory subunit of cAMP-dependent protein kinases [Dyadobacter soli]|uniref:cAMP-binding domain of CRP or a regulatory subunit of cAMP-dependent protein kinases n=1 Tax=Dyadobacter soli TaxID=659014 RepID=A0A1G7PNC2_9BACT|nr:Crp/Fnr family transcriptional regulator [Dyadobacter soli]SDF87694.1 cAMP-binding domain of CRP or a regulatory subunit of cAMP-dependent protein kinases [Dyadobacter soli]
MHTEFENYLAAQTDLSLDTIRHIESTAALRQLNRNEVLLSAGEICRHKVFIASGMLRSYHLRTDGSEHILQFSPQHSWTLDVESYDKQAPSLINIEAVERSTVLLWTKPDFDKLLKEIPALKKFSEALIARTIYHNRNRILTILSGTPEERYADFITAYPDYLARLPLRMVAAYLGISLKTLTRIRHAQREARIMDK